ncbi:Anaphase-promoting complex subunit 8 [Marasmius tenuissimus]|uniref:Anaphase-promoting complex subunit 8 n=1 Tax=Marasmius tenuissimus TaxID=585030 RepID=A0ABR3AFS4_9AGAR
MSIPAAKRRPSPSSPQFDATFSTSTPAKHRNITRQDIDVSIEVPPSPTPGDYSHGMTELDAQTQDSPLHRHPHAPILEVYSPEQCKALEQTDSDQLNTARGLMQGKDYARAVSVLEGCQSPNARFLSLYARFLTYEEDSGKNWHRFDQTRRPLPLGLDDKIHQLLAKVKNARDPFLLYLKALFSSRLILREEAIENALLSIAGFPWCWETWCLLASCIEDGEELSSLISLLPLSPEHPLVQIFQIKTLVDLHTPTENELSMCEQLTGPDYFHKNLWIMSLRACGYFYLHEFSQAEHQFDRILSIDPQRIEDIDILSNILYVTDNRLRLTKLVHDFVPLGQDRPEISCLLGNYYSLRADHVKSIKYFRRAVELDPTFLSAWTLLGHEYVEVKNSHAAIQCYRRAVGTNFLVVETKIRRLAMTCPIDSRRKDYRAWYGLGQAYELLNMHQYALHYYQYAAALRPYDARLWQGLGQCYEEMGRLREAVECYKRALISANPHEISVNLLLAKVHRDLDEIAESIAYHRRIVEVCQADLRPVHEYAKSALEVADHQLKTSDGDLLLAKEYVEIVARSNSEDVTRASELLKAVNGAIAEKYRAQTQANTTIPEEKTVE